jgi:hypothetical protein
VAPALHEDVNALDAAYAAVHRDHPFHTPPALAAAIRRLLEQPEFGSILDPAANRRLEKNHEVPAARCGRDHGS